MWLLSYEKRYKEKNDMLSLSLIVKQGNWF